jgi:aryl-alcohol dehydrogenase-like predicted oxidoreductase
MLDNFILGTGNFRKLNQRDVNNLLDWAYDQGIYQIDTAPLYDCELILGNYLRTNPNYEVTTKSCFVKNYHFPDVYDDFHKHIQNLQIDKVSVFFLHSRPIDLINQDYINQLNSIKREKICNSIGYSGSNFDLAALKSKYDFGAFFLTYNGLDILSKSIIDRLGDEIKVYLKRPLANGVYSVNFLQQFQHRKKNSSNDIYASRLKVIRKHFPIYTQGIDFYMSFLLRNQPSANYVFGASSIDHLKQILKSYKSQIQLCSEVNQELNENYSEILAFIQDLNWKSLQ